MSDAPAKSPELTDWEQVDRWRRRCFRDLGFDDTDARWLVLMGVDWHDAQRLILAGCDRETVKRILTPV